MENLRACMDALYQNKTHLYIETLTPDGAHPVVDLGQQVTGGYVILYDTLRSSTLDLINFGLHTS